MSKVFFTADTHFGHANIIKYCKRPFSSAQEMDEMLIRNWNDTVEPGDTVYHLGDFAFDRHPEKYLNRLNGVKQLIRGNHDKQPSIKHGWASINDYREIRVERQKIILCHYAFRVWASGHKGSWSLYGHSHGSLPDDQTLLSIDVGVDCHGFKPISFNQIKTIMKKKTPRLLIDKPNL